VPDDKLQLHGAILVDKGGARQEAVGGRGDKGAIARVPVAHFADRAQIDVVLHEHVGDVVDVKHVAVKQRQRTPHAVVAFVLRKRINNANGMRVDRKWYYTR
jgi:hypothetical protein